MNDNKPLPSTEYSLKSISWHLKTIAEALSVLNQNLSVLLDKPPIQNQRNGQNDHLPF